VRRSISIVVIALGVAGTVLGSSTAAWAHDVVAPANVVAGSTVTVTVAVVNEHDLPTDGIEMQLPPGFALKAPEDVPGWRTDVQKRADGTATAVRWTGGLIDRNASAEFVVTGTAPPTPGSMVWLVAQKSLGSKTYVPPPVAAAPHMTATAAPLTNGTASAAPVPLAAAPQSTATPPVDGIARSRATLALVLAGLALLGVVAFGSATVRRSQEAPAADAVLAAPTETRPARAAKQGGGKRDRAPKIGAGARR
jgi:methionine-rich copper-binding protein CopC